MEDIVINGVSVNKLLKLRKDIQQGAAEFISKNIKQVTELVKEIVEQDSMYERDMLSRQAYDLLKATDVVSDVSGVKFLLPYYEEYGRYDSDEVLSHILENSDVDGAHVDELMSLLTDMEYDSRAWHSSTC